MAIGVVGLFLQKINTHTHTSPVLVLSSWVWVVAPPPSGSNPRGPPPPPPPPPGNRGGVTQPRGWVTSCFMGRDKPENVTVIAWACGHTHTHTHVCMYVNVYMYISCFSMRRRTLICPPSSSSSRKRCIGVTFVLGEHGAALRKLICGAAPPRGVDSALGPARTLSICSSRLPRPRALSTRRPPSPFAIPPEPSVPPPAQAQLVRPSTLPGTTVRGGANFTSPRCPQRNEGVAKR